LYEGISKLGSKNLVVKIVGNLNKIDNEKKPNPEIWKNKFSGKGPGAWCHKIIEQIS